MRCYGCGVEKDPAVDEIDLYGDDIPVAPFAVLECEDSDRPADAQTDWRAVVVCCDCSHRLEPDMWISKSCWESLNPKVSYASLPPVKKIDTEVGGKKINVIDWRAESYPDLLASEADVSQGGLDPVLGIPSDQTGKTAGRTDPREYE